jgi:hypothetical protein
MKKSSVFPSRYLKSDDIPKPTVATISGVDMHDFGDETKAVMTFEELDKGMVLNLTNWGNIEEDYGDDSDDWIGRKVNVRVEKVAFKGKMVPGLRIYPVEDAAEPVKGIPKADVLKAFKARSVDNKTLIGNLTKGFIDSKGGKAWEDLTPVQQQEFITQVEAGEYDEEVPF